MTAAGLHGSAPVRFGFVGLGWWGDQLAQAVRRADAGVIAACFARSPDARASFAAAHGCRPVDDLDELLAAEDVDALVLATPHSTHLPMIAAAADAGKHVFVEKPLTVLYREAREAVDVARNAGIVLQVGHHRRKVAATRALRRGIDAGTFGLVQLIEAAMTSPSDITPRGGWRGEPDECPLSGMTAMGVHMVDAIHYLDGPVREVYASTRRLLAHGQLDDVTTLALDLQSGVLATLSTSIVLPRRTAISVHGHEGSGWSEIDGAELYLQQASSRTRERQPLEVNDAVADQMREFADCVRLGTEPESNGERGAEVVAVLEAARVSVAEHRPVAVADVHQGRVAIG